VEPFLAEGKWVEEGVEDAEGDVPKEGDGGDEEEEVVLCWGGVEDCCVQCCWEGGYGGYYHG
jgi:hypothetical protein